MGASLSVTDANDRFESPAFLSRARSGEPEAIAELFERFGAMVFGIAVRLTKSHEDAMDVVQDVFMDLAEALHGYKGHGSLEGWIKTVAFRTAYRRNRSSKRRAEVPLEVLSPSETAEEPPGHVDRMMIEEAIANLPESLRIVFVMRVIGGYAHSEIARMVGITTGTSKVRLYRAKDMLRRIIGD